MPPSIRYATADDGARIAFAALGEGVPLLVLPPFPFTHLEAGWRLAGQARWFERLAGATQIALYDARGTGLSDRDRAEYTLEAMTADLEAVRERLGWERFAVCGLFNSTPVALAYVARHPERVSDLVLWGAFARGVDVYPMAVPANAGELLGLYWPMLVETAARTWTASASSDEVAEVVRYFHACVEPAAALAAFSAARDYDVSALLPEVQAHTLLLHRGSASSQRPEIAQAMTARIPDAELAILKGEAASPFSGDVDAAADAVLRFLGLESAAPARSDDAPPHEALTARESEVLRLLARGQANKQIALDLGVSVHTVERHLTNLYAKLGCQSRTEAVAYALTHGYS